MAVSLTGTSERIPPLAIIYVIFLLSGFSGLIYESIWTHYLKLFLGHAAYAQTLVLAIFMGGMAIGSSLAAGLSNRLPRLLLAYAVVEIIVGVQGLFFHRIFVGVTAQAFDSWLPALADPTAIQVAKWSLGGLLILPQSILLGATFPLISAAVIRCHPEAPGRVMANLYSLNSFGAAAGVLTSGFVLISLVGLPGTMLTAGLMNILLGGALLLVLQRYGAIENQPFLLPRTNRVATEPFRVSHGKLLLLTAALTGLSSFIYEMIWIRMLSLLLGASTHAFELMLSAFILGLAIGGMLIRRHIDKVKHAGRLLAWIQLLMGLSAALTLVLYNTCFEWMAWVFQGLQANTSGYSMFMIASHVFALLMMLPATIFAGMTLPLITHCLLQSSANEKSIGYVYAANTLGAIVGVFLAVHFLMPVLGLKQGLLVGCAIDIVLGIVLFIRYGEQVSQRIRGVLAGAMVMSLVVIIEMTYTINLAYVSSGVFRHGQLRDREILFHKDGKTSTVDVIRSDSTLALITNGKPDAAVRYSKGGAPLADEYTMALLALIPLSVVPAPKHVAVVGMGSGITTHTLLADSDLVSVDTIEIEPAMIEGARQFGARSERAFLDPRSRIVIEDAKTFFTRSAQKYDLIVSEPSNPWVSGVSSLFTREFYRHASRYLSDQGVFAQWLHIYEMDNELVATIILALGDAFPDYAIYQLNDTDLLVVASNKKTMQTPIREIFRDPVIRAEGEHLGITHLDDLKLRHIGNRNVFEPIFSGWTLTRNSDYFPVLDQNALRTRFLRNFSHAVIRWSELRFLLGDAETIPMPTTAPLSRENAHVMKIAQAREVSHFLSNFRYAEPLQLQDHQNPIMGLPQIPQFVDGIRFCTINNPVWINSALSVITNVGFYLSREEGAAMWRALAQNSHCEKSAIDGSGWWQLFQTMASRDFPAATVAAQGLLSDQSLQDPVLRRFVAFVLVSSYLKTDRYEDAIKAVASHMPGEKTDQERVLLHLALHGYEEAGQGRRYVF
jgi:spermidine synthase